MKKRMNIALSMIGIVVMLLLFLISSTDLVLKEQEQPVYNISIVFGETSDEVFANYKKGVEQTFSEWKADVNYVTLYDKNDVNQQMELIMREIENGADAIVLFPIHAPLLSELLQEQAFAVPVICVESTVDSEKVITYIHGDNQLRGQELAEKIMSDMGDEKRNVYAFVGVEESSAMRDTRLALEQVFHKYQISYQVLMYGDEEELGKLAGNIYRKDRKAVFIACGSGTMQSFLDHVNQYIQRTCGVYGIGFNNEIVYQMNEGIVRALAVHNDFDMGYLSFYYAREVLSGKQIPTDILVQGGLVTKENMYERQYQKLLFPIE